MIPDSQLTPVRQQISRLSFALKLNSHLLYFLVNRFPKRKLEIFQSLTLDSNLYNVGQNQPD